MRSLSVGVAAAGLAVLASASVSAETVTVTISNDAPYETALKCYQFHGVSSQVMKAASESAEIPEATRQRLAEMSGFAGFVQQHWRQHVNATKGDRSSEQVNADLKTKTASVIADAKSGIEGDASALERQRKLEQTCALLEQREVIADAE